MVVRNTGRESPSQRIAVTPNLDTKFWTSSFNRVEGNVVEGSGRADLALAGPAGPGTASQETSVDHASGRAPGLRDL